MESVYVLKNILDADAVDSILSTLREEDFRDGRDTAAGMARAVKHNEQIEIARLPGVVDLLTAKVAQNTAFRNVAMPRHVSNIIVSRYRPGMSYGLHTDNAVLRSGHRADISFTLFLSDPDSYEGGELCLVTAFGEQRVKLPAGSLVLYPTGMLHRVDEVSAGERIAVVGWVQSRVRDPRHREILIDLDRVRVEYLKNAGHDHAADLLLKTSTNLRRMWDE